jgi:hypothetical protein
VAVVLVLAAVAWWLLRPPSSARDPLAKCYARFCKKLAAAGVPREPWEGPIEFTERAAEQFLEQAGQIRKIGILYARQRYGKEGGDFSKLQDAVNGTDLRNRRSRNRLDSRHEQ